MGSPAGDARTQPATEFGKPGEYVTIVESTAVKKDVERDSTEVGDLAEGTKVDVVEVRRCEDERRIRGRIADPAGEAFINPSPPSL
eukprot:gene57181-biopygen23946